MKIHKFRAIADETVTDFCTAGGWVYGSLIADKSRPYIVGEIVEASEDGICPLYWIPVRPETIGAFTTLLDREGKEIYEGDILTVPEQYPFFVDNQPNYRAVVEWCYAAWYAPLYSVSSSNAGRAVGGQLDEDGTDEGQRSDWLVVGNVHENPDLLERKQ